MPTNEQSLPANGINALALAASQYADAKTRDDANSESAWRKVIYNLVASKQHTLV